MQPIMEKLSDTQFLTIVLSAIREALGSLMEKLSDTQFLTIVLSAIGGALGSLMPIIVARYNAKQAAIQAKATVDAAAVEAASKLKTEARKDAVAEWQALYGERDKEVHNLRTELSGVKAQNSDQQEQLNELKRQHQDCEEGRQEDRRAADRVHTELRTQIEGVKEIAINGGSHP